MGNRHEAATDRGVVSHISTKYVSEWIQSFNYPGPPLFMEGAKFDDENGRVFRLLSTSLTLTFVAVGLDRLALGKHGALSNIQLYWLVCLALAALMYWFVARAFLIRISRPQVFYVFTFIVLPWIPIFAILRTIMWKLQVGIIFVTCELLFFCNVLWFLAVGISLVSRASRIRCLVSIVFTVALTIGAAILWGS